jgi:hypothetical protein
VFAGMLIAFTLPGETRGRAAAAESAEPVVAS